MKNKRICLLAHDAAPSGCFKLLKNALMAAYPDVEVTLVVGDGKPITETDEAIQRTVAQSDFLLLGMSSSAEFAESEIKAARWAKEAHVPFGFYSDVALAVYRAREGAWFNEFANDVDLVTGLLPQGDSWNNFVKARCVDTGNPLREEMSFPKITREESRARLGVLDEDILILLAGGKYAAGNSAMIFLLLEALSNAWNRERYIVVFAPHPGDTTLRAYDSLKQQKLPLYEEICADAPVRMQFITKETMSTSEVLVGADLVVEFTGSASVEAAYLRIPVISLIFEAWFKRFEKESGMRKIETVEIGTSFPVYGDVRELEATILDLTNKSSSLYQELIGEQVGAFPTPVARGETIRKLVTEIGPFIT